MDKSDFLQDHQVLAMKKFQITNHNDRSALRRTKQLAIDSI
jgi:hypothetical protein